MMSHTFDSLQHEVEVGGCRKTFIRVSKKIFYYAFKKNL